MVTEAIIWVVDDDVNNFSVIQTYLSGENYTLQHFSQGEGIIHALEEGYCVPDIILLDLMMPGVSGIEVCQRLKANPIWQPIPVIFVTALSARDALAKCFASGADDFLNKPITRAELSARVRSMLRLSNQYQAICNLNEQLQHSNDQLSHLNQHLEVQIQERTADLEWTFLHDEQTKLPNRNFLLQKIQSLLDEETTNKSQFTLFHLDCDKFQMINDSLGYAVGDRILKELAIRLKECIASTDILTRVGADQFCIFASNLLSQEGIDRQASQLLSVFQAPFEIDYYTVFLTASLGIFKANSRYQQADEPLRNATTALHKAKRQGQGTYVVFEPQMHHLTLKRLHLENDLRQALQNNNFVVYYQPILNLMNRQTIAFEALVRWQDPQRGMVPPGEFITCAEDSGLIIPIGRFVLQKACEQMQIWSQAGFNVLTMSVNLSARQLTYPSLLNDIEDALSQTGLPPTSLQLEITESYLMENYQVAAELTQQVRSLGVKLSLDDFGTGYSSLAYLTQFPVSNIKLDRCFIQNLDSRVQDAAIVKAMIAMGKALGMSVTAEGIETTEHLSRLTAMGCEQGQGYYFSRPMRAEKATEWLIRHYQQVAHVA
jgi:diguanylate cyclase